MSKAKQIKRFSRGTYMFTCFDGEKTPPLREKHLFGHLDHIETHNEKYRLAGPMRHGPDSPIFGSFFLIEADSEAEAWDVMKGDPYISSGMYESISVNEFTPACGAMMGGVIWDQEVIRANIKKHV